MRTIFSLAGAVVLTVAVATTSYATTWKSVELKTGSGGAVTTANGSPEAYEAIVVRSLVTDGIRMKRASARLGGRAFQSSSGAADWLFSSELHDRYNFELDDSAPGNSSAGHNTLVRVSSADGTSVDPDAISGIHFSIFEADAFGNAIGSALGSITGTGAFNLFLRPSTLYLLQATGDLAADLSSALGLGPTSIAGYGVSILAAPVPPAILGFLTALGALFAFRRMRRRSAEEQTV